jgi:hypothetical protein
MARSIRPVAAFGCLALAACATTSEPDPEPEATGRLTSARPVANGRAAAIPSRVPVLREPGALSDPAAVSTDRTAYATSDTITVTWKDLPTAPQTWIGLAAPGAALTAVARWALTAGAVRGSIAFEAFDLSPGAYVARAFAADTYAVLAESAAFSVASPARATVTVDHGVYTAGLPIVISWSSGTSTPHDWLGIAPAGSPTTAVTHWRYTGGAAQGSGSLEAPPTDGAYVARLFANDTYIVMGESAAFSVATSARATVTVDRSAYAAGVPIVIRWSAATSTPHDWAAIAPAASPATTVTRWTYTGGTVQGSGTLEHPLTGGLYVARLFANDTYIVTGESVAFIVQ